MSIKYDSYRGFEMFSDENKNIVIFPMSRSDGTGIDIFKGDPYSAYYPIELIYPYTAKELAEKVKIGFDEWNKHECYGDCSGKNTLEEKYYRKKGFKSAVKGKRYFRIGWGSKYFGNDIDLQIPLKRGYAYLSVKSIKLPADADYIDYANKLIELIEIDLTTIDYFNSNRSSLNI